MQLTGRVALVTGASSGIGRATALALARAGAQVLVHGRDPGRTSRSEARLRCLTLPEGRFIATGGREELLHQHHLDVDGILEAVGEGLG